MLYVEMHMWQSLQKQGMCAHKVWLFFQTSTTHNVLWWYAMAMKFPTLIQNVTGYILQVTEYKYSILYTTKIWPAMW